MNKNKKTTIAQAILASLTLAIGSQAFAQQETPNSVFAAYSANPEGFNRVVMKGKLIDIGERSKSSTHTKLIQGFANDLPLLTVLKQLTPNGWIVKKNDSQFNPLDVNKLVSWNGGKTWVETFNDIAEKYNIDFVIDWSNHTIIVSNSQIVITPKEPKKIAVFELAGDNNSVNTATSNTNVSVSQEVETKETTIVTTENDIKITETKIETVAASTKNPQKTTSETQDTENIEVVKVVAPAPIIEWHMISSKTLKENVEAWASTTGYKVRWTGKDYPVEDRVFTGSFDELNGPIHQLSIDYGYDPQTGEPLVEAPLAFQFYKNGVLVVENAEFEQLFNN